MAYQIKKSNRITEDLELLNEDNTVALTITVDIDVDNIAKNYRRAQANLSEAERSANQGDEESLERYGSAVIEFFGVIFGTDNTVKMLKYFEDKYSDMVIQCMPFISDVINPAMQATIENKKQMLANNFNLSRAQKRKLNLK